MTDDASVAVSHINPAEVAAACDAGLAQVAVLHAELENSSGSPTAATPRA